MCLYFSVRRAMRFRTSTMHLLAVTMRSNFDAECVEIQCILNESQQGQELGDFVLGGSGLVRVKIGGRHPLRVLRRQSNPVR